MDADSGREVDTMGVGFPFMKQALSRQRYPGASFKAVRGFCWEKNSGVDMDRTRRERRSIRNRERVSEG